MKVIKLIQCNWDVKSANRKTVGQECNDNLSSICNLPPFKISSTMLIVIYRLNIAFSTLVLYQICHIFIFLQLSDRFPNPELSEFGNLNFIFLDYNLDCMITLCMYEPTLIILPELKNYFL